MFWGWGWGWGAFGRRHPSLGRAVDEPGRRGARRGRRSIAQQQGGAAGEGERGLGGRGDTARPDDHLVGVRVRVRVRVRVEFRARVRVRVREGLGLGLGLVLGFGLGFGLGRTSTSKLAGACGSCATIWARAWLALGG